MSETHTVEKRKGPFVRARDVAMDIFFIECADCEKLVPRFSTEPILVNGRKDEKRNIRRCKGGCN